MSDSKDLKEILEQTQRPFSSPGFDTWTAAWAVSKRKKKVAAQSVPDATSDTLRAVENDPETIRRKTENLFQGPVLDTWTAAWAASKGKIKARPEPKKDNAQVVRQIYTDIYTGILQNNLAAVLQAFAENQTLAENIEWQSPGPKEIPWAGTIRGREQLARRFAILDKTRKLEQFVPREFIAQGNQVVVMCDERSRVKATGKVYEVALVAVWTLLNGEVTHYRESYDTATVLAALQEK